MEEESKIKARVQMLPPGLSQEQLIFHNMQANHWLDPNRSGYFENLPGINDMSCMQLLTLANMAGTSSAGAAALPVHYGADSSAAAAALPVHYGADSQVGSWKTVLDPWCLNPDESSLGLNTAAERTMKEQQYDVLASKKFVCDLNLTPEEIMKASLEATEPELPPITLETPGKILPETIQEPQRPIEASLRDTDSPAVKRGRKKGKRQRDDIMPMKTPQQKQKKKKLRPKVVKEGKTRRAPSKLGTKKESVSMRKKSKKSKDDLPLNKEEAAETSELGTNSRPKRSSRRALRFDFDIQEEDEYFENGSASGGDVPIQMFSNIPKRRRGSSKLNDSGNARNVEPVLGSNDQGDISRAGDLLPYGNVSTSLVEEILKDDLTKENMITYDQTVTDEYRETDGSNFGICNTSTSWISMKDILEKERIYQLTPYIAPSEPGNACLSSLVNTVPATFMEPEQNLPSDSHNSQCLVDMNTHENLRRKRSSIVTRPRNLQSLKKSVESILPINSDGEGHKDPNTSKWLKSIVSEMQSTVSRKKRSKRNSLASKFNARILQLQWEVVPKRHHLALSGKSTGTSLDEKREQRILKDSIELFIKLDINKENPSISRNEQTALILYQTTHQEQNAVVQYRRDGSIIPSKVTKLTRPKVKLDGETTRVWKLLTLSIDSEGINGTDEEKQKWWKEERNMFQGRANSFIARMRLVQGDRSFSPWKGSVVDSVIGVFLTQNVADHSSSSAFMDIAAAFPINLNSNKGLYSEEWESSVTHETLMNLDPGNAVAIPQIHNPTCIIHEIDDEEDIDVVCSNETSRVCNNLISSANQSKGKPLNPTEKSLETNISLEAREQLNCEEKNRETNESSQYCNLLQYFKTLTHALNVKMAAKSCLVGRVDEKATSNDIISPNLSAPKDTLEQDIIQERRENSVSLFGTVLVNKHMDPKMVKTDSQTPNTNGFTGFSQGISTCQLNLNEENFEVENFDVFRNKVDEGSQVQPMSNLQQEVNSTLQAQDQEVVRRTDQYTNTESVSRENNILIENHLSTQNKTFDSDINECMQTSNEENRKKPNTLKSKGGTAENKKNGGFDWDSLRRKVESNGQKRERTERNMDTVDWDAMRCADRSKISDIIRQRGMNHMLSARMQAFLNRLVQEHGSIDLEWLRDVHPDKAKEYLLSIDGLGLKSVECVRLLSLHQIAFPVDTNVGRIAVRLGWVPLQPLPEEFEIHRLELYPDLASVQKYLWPRLCKLDQKTLYELHYHMITFGKVFCTKQKPNCNACPLRAECRHYASACASARLSLPEPEESRIVTPDDERCNPEPVVVNFRQSLFLTRDTEQAQRTQTLEIHNSEAICEPIIEEPATPEQENTEVLENDIEDFPWGNDDEILTFWLNKEATTQNSQNNTQKNLQLQEVGTSKDLVALNTQAAKRPMLKLKNESRLRTEHHVYELPASHPLVQGLEKRESDDPCPYLLAIWTPGETANSIQQPRKSCASQENNTLCHEKTCFSCNNSREEKSQIVRGTLLIPCKTGMRSRFPLNGTYFQVNEVFADHESSINPIDVPREWIWNLPRRIVYFGSSVSSIFKGLTVEAIQYCFWRGYVCVRGFDRASRKPRPLAKRLHCAPSRQNKDEE